ncbi:hypothetical protein J2128_002563 [Methanomicrobium sp. W14]|uniref:hypothetical protein n=1 Tax=Methanomicrobium sp. W14 TaxID=2817839 RepID=UPI001AE990C6|nr:hypothetical protein [Methanomicrobium sp. W14]MBP2134592.1 hypothetical protein [Methanomicrobium sp. W14]
MANEISNLDNLTEIKELGKDKFIFDLIYQRHLRELERLNSLDNKASNTILFVGIIFSLFSAALGISTNNWLFFNGEYIVSLVSRFSLIFGILCLTVSIICSIKAYCIKTLDDVPNTQNLITKYAMDSSINYKKLIGTIGTELSKTIKDNSEIINKKADFIKYSLFMFGIGMILILSFIFEVLLLK